MFTTFYKNNTLKGSIYVATFDELVHSLKILSEEISSFVIITKVILISLSRMQHFASAWKSMIQSIESVRTLFALGAPETAFYAAQEIDAKRLHTKPATTARAWQIVLISVVFPRVDEH